MINRNIKKIAIFMRMVSFSIFHLKKPPKILGKIYYLNNNVKFGKKVTISRNVKFWRDGPIFIGNHVAISDNCTIFASKGAGVYIGNETVIAADSYIIDMNHGYAVGKSAYECNDTYEKIIIGENVWIGQNLAILKGAGIPNSCVLGAKSLANKKFPEEVIIGGIPAKILKKII